jgi:hypothetical protein
LAAVSVSRGLRLHPVESMLVVAVALACALLALIGRTFDPLLRDSFQNVFMQFNWLVPCLLARHWVALFEVPAKRARLIYLGYFVALTLALFGSDIESALTRAYVLRRMGGLVQLVLTLNGAAFWATVLATCLVWRNRPDHAKAVTRAQLSDLARVLRLLIVFAVFLAYVSNTKAIIPLVNPNLCDWLLLRFDCSLLFGHSPYEMLSAIHTPTLTSLMKTSYFFLFFLISFGFTGTLLFGTVRHFERLFASIVVAGLIASVLYYALPSLGPAFAEETRSLLPQIQGGSLRAHLSAKYWDFRADPNGHGVTFLNGLAAFPSLHIVHALLVLHFLWKLEHTLVYLLLIPFLLMCASTVYLGWHYVFDLVSAVPITVVCVRLGDRLCGVRRGEESEKRDSEAAAGDGSRQGLSSGEARQALTT